jgi:DNA-binding GntR family transcriptional regulator
LPSEKELEQHYRASRNTVRDALAWLRQQGYVVSEQGRGTFVAPRPHIAHVTLRAAELGLTTGAMSSEWYNRDAAIPADRNTSVSQVKVEVQEGSEVIAGYLRMKSGSEFISRHQEIFLDDRPWVLQTSFYPLEFATSGASRLLLPRDIPEGAVAYLGEALGYREAGFHDEIKARVPDENEKRFFSLGDSSASIVFETVRTAYSADGNPFRVTVTVWPADRTRLHYNDGKVPTDVLRAPGEASTDATPAEDAGSE